MHRLGKASTVGTHILIGWVLGMAISIAHFGGKNALHLFEEVLGAPEAPAS